MCERLWFAQSWAGRGLAANVLASVVCTGLDRTELGNSLARLDIALDVLAVDELFAGIDQDKNGSIDIEEFLAFLEGCQPLEGSVDEKELALIAGINEIKEERAKILIGSEEDPLDGMLEVDRLNNDLSLMRDKLLRMIGTCPTLTPAHDWCVGVYILQYTDDGRGMYIMYTMGEGCI